MSVINQVLNDIEQRKNKACELDANKFSALELKEPSSKILILVTVPILVGVLMAITWWQYQNWTVVQAPPDLTGPVASISASTANGACETAVAKANLRIDSVAKQFTSNALEANTMVSKITVATVANDALKQVKSSSESVVVKGKIAMTAAEVAVADQQKQNINAWPKQDLAKKISVTKDLSIESIELTSNGIAALKFNQALELQEQGDLFKAQDLWRESLVALPSYHQARERLALSYIELNNIEQALAILSEGIKAFPSQQQYQLLAAKVYWDNQQLEQALLILDRPYRFIENSNELIASAAAIAQTLQQWQQAELNYDVLVAREKNNEKWLMGLAIALDAQGKIQPAIMRYSQLILLPEPSLVLADYAQRRIVLLQAQQGVQ